MTSAPTSMPGLVCCLGHCESSPLIKIIDWRKMILNQSAWLGYNFGPIPLNQYYIFAHLMNFEDSSRKAECPYNKNHVFDRQKLIFHINRCKDKQKVGHLFTHCQYNRIHIILKQDISIHELTCPDKEDIKRLTQQLTKTLREVDRERERSREKTKKQQGYKEEPKEEIKSECASDHIVYEECPLCRFVVDKLPDIEKGAPAEMLTKIKIVKKLIKMNSQFNEAMKKLQSTH